MVANSKIEAKKISKEERIVDGLEMIYEKLGKPRADVESLVFWKFLGQLIQVWTTLFPQEVEDWKKDLKLDLSLERSLSESTNSGLKKSIAFPPRLYQLVRVYFPDLKVTDSKFIQRTIDTFPILHNSNYR